MAINDKAVFNLSKGLAESRVTGAKVRARQFRRVVGAADEVWQMWHGKMLRCSEAMAEIIPKGDAEFATGVHQSEESVATIATGVAVRATADLALDDVTANVALGTIGVQRYLWPVEHGEQLGLVGMQSLQKAIERDEAGAAAEDMRSKRARISLRRRGVGAAQYALRSA